MNIIEVENLEKSYGKVRAVDGISFAVERGCLFSFLGVNGAGKSTTINILPKRPLCGLLDNCVAPHLPHPQGPGQHFIAVEQLQHDLVLSSVHTVLGDQLLHRGKKDTVRAALNPLFLPELSPAHR